jgi:phage protein D
MLTPAYRITIGKTIADSINQPASSTAVDLMVRLDMEVAADSFSVVLGQVGGMLHPALNDKATVELGYADSGSLTQVITGKVISVRPTFSRIHAVAFTAAETLLRSYLDQTYEDKTAGAIVRDLANRTKVPLGNIEDGITFPFYVIDGRRSFAHHMRDLADMCGFDLYFTAAGDLAFRKFGTGTAIHVFEHAKDIFELEATHTLPEAGAVQVFGESPTSSKGSGSSAWLTNNFTRFEGRAGSGMPIYLLERAALRTREAAKAAAAAEETRIRQDTVRGRFLVAGHPEVKLGDSIQLRKTPDTSLTKSFQVRSVTHRLSKRRGFSTEIGFRSI